MEKIIRLVYRKIIDEKSVQPWEKYVYDDTYAEFSMQSQFYNREKKYTSFRDMIINIPGATKLHFLISAGATSYLRQLNGIIPDIKNVLGKSFLSFDKYDFEVISSDIKDRAEHRVAISFYSVPLIWHETIGDKLLVSDARLNNETGTIPPETRTNLVILPPFLSIYSIQTKNNEPVKS